MKLTVRSQDLPDFDITVEDPDEQGYDIYCEAMRVWGKNEWHECVAYHGDEVVTRFINANTMIPKVVGVIKKPKMMD